MSANRSRAPLDAASQALALPEDLRAALAADAAAQDLFQRLAPSHRREYIDWIVAAKQPATRARRIAKTLDMLASQSRAKI